MTEPIPASGKASSPVDARSFTAEVVNVAFARSITDGTEEDGLDTAPEAEAIEADGVWIVVTADITAAEHPLSRVDAALETGDGTTYAASTWLMNTFGSSGGSLAPGIPQRGAVVFEVSQERLKSPSVRLNVLSGLDRRLSGVAVIDLELKGPALTQAIDGAEELVAVPPVAAQEV